MKPLPGLALALLAGTALGGCTRHADPPEDRAPVVRNLAALLEARPDLRAALTEAIDSARVQGIESLEAFHEHVHELVTWIPVEREIVPKVLSLHYVINQAPDDALNRDEAFSAWLHGVAEAWGAFLDSPASAAGIASFTSVPDYRADDYVPGPSGWLTFNQFFARQIRPGKRPIADPQNDAVVVSPADAVFMGAWPIDEASTITVKGAEWRIADLLEGGPYATAFANGIYMHSFLRPHDYHRFHVPVGGEVRDVRTIHARVYLDVVRRPDGSLASVNGDTYQFNQERGILILESATVGLVALVPVGMTLISSVNLTPDVGARLRKGEEVGYFQFGGSDIVMLFQDRNVVIEAEVGAKYLQGERIGRLETR
jgi:phosphatidylserine decarboxylase